MSSADTGKRLLWHGLLLVLLGLLTGLVIPLLTNPRMGLSAHLEGVMNGVLLAVLAALAAAREEEVLLKERPAAPDAERGKVIPAKAPQDSEH